MSSVTDKSQSLRILHLIPGSDAGGWSRYVFDLCFAMHAKGHKVAVAGARGSWHWLFDTAPFPWIDAPPKKGWFGGGRASGVLSRWVEENPVDLLHVHDVRCIELGREIQKSHAAPMLYTMHQPEGRASDDFGDHTHVASKELRSWLVEQARVPQQLISVVPHGVDPQRFPIADETRKTAAKQSLGISATSVVAAYVGRMDSPKNEEWMLDLADQSRQRLPNLKVVMVGEGPNETMLRRRVEQQKLHDRVVLLGFRDPLPIYHAADALLLPSQREGFSLVCAEAMSTGIPVLRTRTAGTDALVVENATGRSCDIDHDQFVAAAIEFLADLPSLQRMGKLAAKHVHTHFSFDRQLSDTVDMYRSLVKLQGKKPESHNPESE